MIHFKRWIATPSVYRVVRLMLTLIFQNPTIQPLRAFKEFQIISQYIVRVSPQLSYPQKSFQHLEGS